MRIAVVAHIRHPIAQPFAGGMEAHCHQLTTALVARGHEVTLFASGDSDHRLPLRLIAERAYDQVLPWAEWRGTARLTAFQDEAFCIAWDAIRRGGYDVVHNNAMYPAIHGWAARDRQPMVTSLHVPPFADLADAIGASASPWLRRTVTSRAHGLGWWQDLPATASVVHNGIDTGRWRFAERGNGRAVWAGRITPNKGTAIAIEAAARAGVPLDLIGPIECRDYFGEQIAPTLGGSVVYHGHLSGERLVAAIGAASVMLATPMWDEPFGLTAAEALACGVPVAALDRGALREVVGPCGTLTQDAESLAAAIPAAMTIPRAACRTRVERLFSIDRMIAGYEAAYAAAIAGTRASSSDRTVAELA